MYSNLNLKEWPFKTVPDAEFATIWAGRPLTKLQLERLLQKMQLVPRSGLHLLWANFGMGKTHTLLHIQHRCQQTKGALIPVFAVMPKRSTGFLELYREIVLGMPYEFLGDQLIKVGSGSSGSSVTFHPLFRRSPGVVQALLAIRSGDAERANIALQWLAAQPGLGAKELRLIGVTYRIKTPEDAINSLSALTALGNYKNTPPKKLVVMIDEYQRVGELSPKLMSENNASLHTFFNQNPTGLELILSFSFGRQENLSYLLSGELKSRAEPLNISLDVMNREEAVGFLSDLLAQFRVREDKDQWAFPFSPAAVNTLLIHISQRKSLTPRRIMLYANHVLTEHMINYPGSDKEIGEKEMLHYLSDPELGTIDTDSDEGFAE